jgi:hypothetical protein
LAVGTCSIYGNSIAFIYLVYYSLYVQPGVSFAQLFQCYNLKATIFLVASPHSNFFIFQHHSTFSFSSFNALFFFQIMHFYIVLAVAVSSVLASPFSVSPDLQHRAIAPSLAGQFGAGACLGDGGCCGVQVSSNKTEFCPCAAADQNAGNVCPHIISIMRSLNVHLNHSARWARPQPLVFASTTRYKLINGCKYIEVTLDVCSGSWFPFSFLDASDVQGLNPALQ